MSFKFRNDYKFSDSRENDITRSTPQHLQNLKNDAVFEENAKLRDEISEKNFELQELQTELSAIKQLVDNKDQSMLKLRDELKAALILNKKAVGEQRFLHEEILTLQREQEKLLGDYELLLSKFEAISAEKVEKNRYVENLEQKICSLEQGFSETRSKNLQLEIWLQEVKEKEQESQHEIKLVTNQISSLQEMEDEYAVENQGLRQCNEEYSEKILGMALEIQEIQKEIRYKDCKINDLTRELAEYEEVFGELKGNEDEFRRNHEEKERGIKKIKEFIICLDEKERIIEEKQEYIREIENSAKKIKEDNCVLSKKCTESLNDLSRARERNEELLEKIELLEEREKDVKSYLARKCERLNMRKDAESQLLSALNSVY